MSTTENAPGAEVNDRISPVDDSAGNTGTALSTTVDQTANVPVEPESAVLKAAQRARLRRRLLSSSPLLMFGVLILMFLVFSLAHPATFPSVGNIRNILLDTSILMVMAVGFTFVMIAAGFDLSQGSVLVFAQIIGAKVMLATGGQGGWAIVLGVLVAILAGVVWGIFNGLVITKLRVPPLITTLGSLGAALGVGFLITNGEDIRDVPNAAIAITRNRFLGMPWLVWVALIVVILGALLLHLTRFGRHTFIIGSNAEAARRAGINVDRHLIKLYVIASALAGFAGMMSLVRYTATTVGGHGTDSLAVVTGVALGGVSLFGGIGLMIGTVIGMFIPTVLNYGLVSMSVSAFWQQVAIGLILIFAVYLNQLKRKRRNQV